MKRIYQHPKPSKAEETGPKYWRSLDELAQTPDFQAQVDREFPEGASDLNEVDRRHFLKIMAASFAVGGLGFSGCRRPESHILPYAESPENIIPGVPVYYATSMPLREGAVPLLVETHQGRPTKIEGNPSYFPYGGGTTGIAQASVLDLYDPDRSTSSLKGEAPISVEEVGALLTKIGNRYAEEKGEGLAFLAESSSSSTRRRLLKALREKFPKAIWSEYDAVGSDEGQKTASRLLGRSVKPSYSFEKAKRVLSLESDFIESEEGHLKHTRDFANGRRVKKHTDSMNRLYIVESGFSLTGGMADHRLRLASSQMTSFAAALAKALGIDIAELSELAAPVSAHADWIAACAEDLRGHKGASIVVGGSHLPDAAQGIIFLINEHLGNIGETVTFVEFPENQVSDLSELANKIKASEVKTLFVLGGNPIYNAPVDLDWTALQASVEESVRVGYHVDETSKASNYHISSAHYLESWGDARTDDGTIVPVQPMILPLFDGLTEIEVLARLIGLANTDPYSLVLETISSLSKGKNAEKTFQKFLHDGLLEGTAYKSIKGSLDGSVLEEVLSSTLASHISEPSRDSLEVRFMTDNSVDDGRFANNGWLQEAPDPVTKITWDNAIMISPRLAKELDVVAKDPLILVARKNPNKIVDGREYSRVAEVTVNGRTIRGPLHIQPGLANYTMLLPLGYGRTVVGRVGEKAGFSAYALRESGQMHVVNGATIAVTEEVYQLANTQAHWSMEGRAIVREANLEDYQKHPDFVKELGMESHSPAIYGKDAGMSRVQKIVETPQGNSLYNHPEFDGTHQWGMAIDLNTCSGCNACVIACQSENNIPIVGRDQVRRGREMHWIRLDRYYSSGSEDNSEIPEDPQVSIQPVACSQCETAPCETVCPVNATVHNDEGLNVMAYNRCIGTRYCADNCPYKVRRFNFFDFQQRQRDQYYMGPLAPKGMPEILQMAQNPDVSIRMRGVMEKCNYCTQRIQSAKITQKVKAGDSDDIVVPDGTIKTACQQVCASDSIVFGNLLDTESEVSKTKDQDRDYGLLGYLNTRPRTTYLAKIRNPNPAMPDYHANPLSRVEYDAKNHHGGDHGDASDEAEHVEPAAHAVEPGSTSEGGHH